MLMTNSLTVAPYLAHARKHAHTHAPARICAATALGGEVHAEHGGSAALTATTTTTTTATTTTTTTTATTTTTITTTTYHHQHRHNKQ